MKSSFLTYLFLAGGGGRHNTYSDPKKDAYGLIFIAIVFFGLYMITRMLKK